MSGTTILKRTEHGNLNRTRSTRYQESASSALASGVGNSEHLWHRPPRWAHSVGRNGVDMGIGTPDLGFSLAYGSGAIVFFFPLLLTLWALVAAAFAIRNLVKKRANAKSLCMTLALSACVFGILAVPYGFWQQLFVSRLVNGPYAGEFLSVLRRCDRRPRNCATDDFTWCARRPDRSRKEKFDECTDGLA
jgi:hypothetical protein